MHNRSTPSQEPNIFKWFVIAMVSVLLIILAFASTFTVDAGKVGVMVTMGKVSNDAYPSGFGIKAPFITKIHEVSVRTESANIDKADCFSSDLQQLHTSLNVLYRVPEESVVKVFRDYSGDAFSSLIVPRVQEALKEVTANQTAEYIAKNRELIKNDTLKATRHKVGPIVEIADINIVNIGLSPQLMKSIEEKMVQQQLTAKAVFVKEQATTDAETAKIKAQGEANAIQIRGKALQENPKAIELQLLEKWDGRAPMYIGGGLSGSQFILPLPQASATEGKK